MDAQVGKEVEQKFLKDDSCVLKSNPSLIGYIAGTPYDIESEFCLEDLQVYSYTVVPEALVESFKTTGMPPEQHYFVNFFEASQGSALVHEDDLQLVDRNFDVGGCLKRISNGSMMGKVVGASTKCTLEPVVYRPIDPITGEVLPAFEFTERPCEVFRIPRAPGIGPGLLYDVPYSELCGHEKFSEGDHIVYGQKLGLIERIERDVVIFLPSSGTVTSVAPLCLEVLAYGKHSTAISKPGLRYRRCANGIHAVTTFAAHNPPGKSMFITNSHLDRGDRVPGTENTPVQAYVLATTAEDIHIHWLCPNVFSDISQELTPEYEVWRESRLREKASKCDFVPSTNHFDIGDRVRFRDPASAKLKYPGYQDIPAHQTRGYDMNVFRIVAITTEAVVQWQDGSRSTEVTTDLKGNPELGQGELFPGDLVVPRDGVNIVDRSVTANSGVLPEALFDYLKDTLRIEKLGIVQAVDGRERIASVRWYENPNVELLHGGNKLNPISSFGRLGDTTTNVSVYELSTYGGLSVNLDELVVFAPASIGQSAMSSKPQFRSHSAYLQRWGEHFRFIAEHTYSYASMYLVWMKAALSKAAWFTATTTIRPPLRRRYSIQNANAVPPNDFFGKIVAIDTSGNITIRVPNSDGCCEIQVPFERIMLKNLEPPLDLIPNYGLPAVFSSEASFEFDDTSNVLATEDESDEAPGLDVRQAITAQLNGTTELAENAEDNNPWLLSLMHFENQKYPVSPDFTANDAYASPSQVSELPRILTFPVPTSSPPRFAVLGDLPPIGHHYIGKTNSGLSLLRMKRIRNDFGILSTSLPPGIFVRSWESRMDLLRAIIIGPEDTPYEYAPFVFDIHFGPNYPENPPSVFFHSWNAGNGHVNPNLHEDGHICLSILGTWDAEDPEEGWSPEKSTMLQVLVSMMGLVLVEDPYYNEAGYELFAARNERRVEASQYTEKAFLDTRRFIIHALEQPILGLEDVLIWQYLSEPSASRLLRKAIEKAQGMIDRQSCTVQPNGQSSQVSAFCPRMSKGAVFMLQKHVGALEKLEERLTAGTDS